MSKAVLLVPLFESCFRIRSRARGNYMSMRGDTNEEPLIPKAVSFFNMCHSVWKVY